MLKYPCVLVLIMITQIIGNISLCPSGLVRQSENVENLTVLLNGMESGHYVDYKIHMTFTSHEECLAWINARPKTLKAHIYNGNCIEISCMYLTTNTGSKNENGIKRLKSLIKNI